MDTTRIQEAIMAKKKDGATINFNGKVKIAGDFVTGDKNITQTITNIQNNQTPEAFVQALEDVRGRLATLKEEQALLPAQVAEIEVVEGKIAEAAEASQGEKPNGAEIRKTLDEAKAMLESIGGLATATIGAGAILAEIARMAIVVFGG